LPSGGGGSAAPLAARLRLTAVRPPHRPFGSAVPLAVSLRLTGAPRYFNRELQLSDCALQPQQKDLVPVWTLQSVVFR